MWIVLLGGKEGEQLQEKDEKRNERRLSFTAELLLQGEEHPVAPTGDVIL